MYRYIAAGNSSDDDKDNSIMIKIKRIIIDNYDVSNKDNDDRNDTNDDKKKYNDSFKITTTTTISPRPSCNQRVAFCLTCPSLSAQVTTGRVA